jgi:Tol biopolymer transport system component
VPATATAAPAPSACALVYADAGTLFCLGEDGTPQILATGSQITDPRLSSDGALVAYQVAVAEGISQLWVVSASGGDARLLVGAEQVPNADPALINSPNGYEWLAGTRTLVFDTRFTPTGGPFGPGDYLNADLWTVYADTGAVSALLPAGAAGAFRASPDGQTIAISRPQGLDLVNVDGSNYRQDLITFPAIITYSEYQYRPLPQWSADGTFFNVAIPSPDPMAPDVRADFYRVGVDGIVQPLANVPANVVFGGAVNPPRFSSNGQYVAYSQGQADGSGDVLHLVEFIPGGSVNDRAFEPQPGLQGWGWSPDSQFFAYTVLPGGAPGQGYVTGAAPGTEQPFAAGLTALRTLEWLDAATLVFLGQFGGGDWGLYRQSLGAEPTLLAGGLSLQAALDVRN